MRNKPRVLGHNGRHFGAGPDQTGAKNDDKVEIRMIRRKPRREKHWKWQSTKRRDCGMEDVVQEEPLYFCSLFHISRPCVAHSRITQEAITVGIQQSPGKM